MDNFGRVPASMVACGMITAGLVTAGLVQGQFAAAKTSTGVFTLTISADVGPCICLVSLGTAAGQIQCVKTSATVFTVTTFAADGTTATDKVYNFVIFAIPTTL